MRDNLQQLLEWSEVAVGRGAQGSVEPMITRNVQRVDAIHRARGLRGPLSVFGQGSLPPLQPGRDVLPWHELVERRRISAQFVCECAETRSEERRVGKEWVSTCRSRVWAYH